MANIKAQLTLVDNMSGPLRAMNRAMSIVLDSCESMNTATGNAINMERINEARSVLLRMGDSLEELESRTEKSSDAFSRMAKAIGLAALARKAFEQIKVGIDYASDLAEVQNVVDVTFGNSAQSINSWSRECLEAYGMNEVSAKRYAGTIGAMLKSSGMASDAIVEMSQDMVGLAGDMASFYNLDLETAFEKIRSGVSGETEPLKQLGINMSVANLEAYALSQGIEKSYNEMSQAEQVMLRYNYLMSTTADAQGDFARTSDSWANQTRLLSEGWLEFTGVLAENLIPILTSVASGLNDIIAFLTENADTISAVIVGVAAGVAVLAGAWAIHTAAVWLSVAATQVLTASFLANPVIWLALSIGILVGLMYDWIQSVGGLKNAWEICKAYLLVGMNAVKLGFFTGVYAVMNLIDALKGAWHSAGTAIANFMGDMKVGVLSILQAMINGAIDIINDFISVLNKIPGVNIEAIEHVTFATTAAAENEAAKQARKGELDNYKKQLAASKADRDAKLEGYKAEFDESVKAAKNAYQQAKNEKDVSSGNDQALSDQALSDLSSTSDNTKKIADALDITNANLKYIRDFASEKAINRYTATEIKIDMTNNNNINSDDDIDGIVAKLKGKLEEEMISTAEGVH